MKLVITLFFVFALLPLLHAQTPEIILQTGHSEPVYSVIFSHDGKYGFTASKDRSIKMWDITTGREMLILNGHSEAVKSLSVTSDGKFLISGSEDKSIIIWDINTKKIVKQLLGHTARIDAVTTSPNNTLIASSSTGGDQTVKIWRIDTGKLVTSLTVPGMGTNAVAFMPDNKHLITAGGDSYIRVWDIEQAKVLKSFRKEPAEVKTNDRVSSVAISPDGKRVVAGTKRSKSGPVLTVWDIETETILTELIPKEFNAFSVSYSKDGNYITAGTGSNSIAHNLVRVWDATTFDLVFTSPQLPSGAQSVSISPDNRYVLASGYLQTRMFSINTGQQIHDLDGLTTSQRAFFSPDGKHIVSYGNNTMRIWDVSLGNVARYHAVDSAFFQAADISKDGKTIWAAISNNNIWGNQKFINYVNKYRFDDLSIQLQKRFNDNHNLGKGISISTDNRSVAFSRKNRLTVLQTQTGAIQFESYTKQSWSNQVFLPDNKRIIVSGLGIYAKPKQLELYDFTQPASSSVLLESSPTDLDQIVAIPTSDGKFIASSSYFVTYYPAATQIRIWERTDSLRLRHQLKGHSNYVNSLSFSSDNSKMLSASRDKTVKIWNTADWKETATLSGHAASVVSAVFSDDSKRIVTASDDGSIRLWDAQTNQEMAQFVGFLQSDLWLTITPDGYFYGDKGAFSKVHYLHKGNVYMFDQFDLQYNRPDLVLQQLGTASPERILTYKKAWEKRIRKMGLNPANFEKQISFNVPEVFLENLSERLVETSSSDFTINFSAKDKLYNLDRLFVDVNGVPLFGAKGKSVASSKSKSTKQNISVPLEAGSNKIKISVLNEKGVESLAERIEVIYKPSQAIKPNLNVIAIGVSKFQESDYDLTYADKDANDLTSLMKNATGLYENITVHTLTNENATRANVLKLRSELEKTSVADEVIVFLASHGVLDDELDYYLAMHDMDFANPKRGGLRYDELENLLDAIPARNKLMLIDACHSGEVDKEESQLIDANDTQTNGVKSRGFLKKVPKKDGIGLANSFELMKELFADLRRNNGAVVISSASGKEYAFESSEWANGVFTYSVIEGLKSGNADLNKDKSVSVSELRDYVSKRVKELTNGKQNPTSRTENLENDFRVW